MPAQRFTMWSRSAPGPLRPETPTEREPRARSRPLQTQSHLLLTWFVGDRLRRRLPVHLPAFVIGSVAPDLPLFLLTGWFFAVARPGSGEEALFGPLYDEYFFHHPVWVASHNLFHAPLILLALALAARWATARERPWGWALLWFTAGCALHSGIDVLTHHTDGPLLFFPLNWTFRFQGPVSYWHPDYYGNVVFPLEMGMNALILLYLVSRWWRKRRASRQPRGATGRPSKREALKVRRSAG